MAALPTRVLVESAALWSDYKPGDYALMKFMRDPVCHKMLITWMREEQWATIMSADGDQYELPVIGDGRDRPCRVVGVPRDGVLAAGFGDVDRFRARASDEELCRMMIKGRDMLRRVSHDGGVLLPPVKRCARVVNSAGVEVRMDAFLQDEAEAPDRRLPSALPEGWRPGRC